MGKRCKFYHGSYQELRDYKATEYIENKEVPLMKKNKSKNQK